MFRAFFKALANLTATVETLTASVSEANDNFRVNLGLDHNTEEPEQLHYEPAANGKSSKRKASAKS